MVNRKIPIDSAYSRAYGRTIPPTSREELYGKPYNPTNSYSSEVGHPTNPTFPPPRQPTYHPMNDPAPDPHRWDAWILAGFAVAGIWALALVRLVLV